MCVKFFVIFFKVFDEVIYGLDCSVVGIVEVVVEGWDCNDSEG